MMSEKLTATPTSVCDIEDNDLNKLTHKTVIDAQTWSA